MKRGLAMFAALVAGMPELASAQLMGAHELHVDVPVKGAPSAKPVADVYYLAGEVGAKETYTVVTKGGAGITLFGPDGSEILTSSGSGTVKLEAVLPFTDVFTVAVARKTPTQPYTLSRKTTVPTVLEAAFANGAGYVNDGAETCWLSVGVKLRVIQGEQDSRIRTEYTLSADGSSAIFLANANGVPFAGELSAEYDGANMHRRFRLQNGKVVDDTQPFKPAFDAGTSGRYSGYLCRD